MQDTYCIKYVIPELPRKNSSSNALKQIPEREKTHEEEYAEDVKQVTISWIAK